MRVLAMAAACAALVACAPPETAELTGDALVARGDYLVNNVVLCSDCHTPMGPEGPDHSRFLQGAPIVMTPSVQIPWGEYAPQLAGIPANFTDEQFVAFLQTGVRPDGSHPRPPMPPYRLNEQDARAIAAYIATLPRAEDAQQQN
jgi:mono/diheme cytochrome c family protein